jgi:hypothetical protein
MSAVCDILLECVGDLYEKVRKYHDNEELTDWEYTQIKLKLDDLERVLR